MELLTELQIVQVMATLQDLALRENTTRIGNNKSDSIRDCLQIYVDNPASASTLSKPAKW